MYRSEENFLSLGFVVYVLLCCILKIGDLYYDENVRLTLIHFKRSWSSGPALSFQF